MKNLIEFLLILVIVAIVFIVAIEIMIGAFTGNIISIAVLVLAVIGLSLLLLRLLFSQ